MPLSGQLEKHGENKRKHIFHMFFHVFICFFFVRTSRAIKKTKKSIHQITYRHSSIVLKFIVSTQSHMSQYLVSTLTILHPYPFCDYNGKPLSFLTFAVFAIFAYTLFRRTLTINVSVFRMAFLPFVGGQEGAAHYDVY